MYKLILFDLDGTLLPIDMNVFIQKYFEVLTPYFKGIVEPGLFLKSLKFATQAMIKNQENIINEEVFMNNFLPAVDQERDTIYPYFNDFYEQEFSKLKQFAGYSPWAAQAVGELVEKGYPIVLATNPVFPRRATEERMNWAGVAHFPWSLVTAYENSYRCKPSIEYYQGICQELCVSPQDCLMVGNDVQEDLVAETIGMDTFLVTDFLIDRGEPKYTPGGQGTLEDFYSFAGILPTVK